MDYIKLTLAELRNGISDTKSAIHRCKEVLDNLRQPKIVGLQAMADAITRLLPQAQTRFESPGKSLHHQERIEGTTVAPRQPVGFGFAPAATHFVPLAVMVRRKKQAKPLN
jgi:hypothetical protein